VWSSLHQQSRLPAASIVFGPVAQWMKHWLPEPANAGASPAEVILSVATVGEQAAPSRLHQPPTTAESCRSSTQTRFETPYYKSCAPAAPSLHLYPEWLY
jgi:hypothetical protein